MKHLEELSNLRAQLISDIKLHMSDNGLKLIRFNEMFSCILPEENTFDDSSIISVCIAKRMWDNGELEGVLESEGEWTEWNIDECDSVEVAYILDKLEAGEYTKLDPDSYDDDDDDECDECDEQEDEEC